MTEEQAEQLIDVLIRNNQLLEAIDWKLWEIYNYTKGEKKENEGTTN